MFIFLLPQGTCGEEQILTLLIHAFLNIQHHELWLGWLKHCWPSLLMVKFFLPPTLQSGTGFLLGASSTPTEGAFIGVPSNVLLEELAWLFTLTLLPPTRVLPPARRPAYP